MEPTEVEPRPLTKEEKAAIATLHRLSKRWPKSLWLFSASGELYVMKCNSQGEQAVRSYGGGGVDQRFIVDRVDIPNDGGDW